MEQLQNGLLTMIQTTLSQVPGVGGKSENSGTDDFQKLLERAQNPQDVEQPEPAQKTETKQTTQERKDSPKAEDKKEPAQKKEEDPVETVKRMQVYLAPLTPEELAQYPAEYLPKVEEGEPIVCIGVQTDENGQQVPILVGANEAAQRFGWKVAVPEAAVPQGEIELPEEMLLDAPAEEAQNVEVPTMEAETELPEVKAEVKAEVQPQDVVETETETVEVTDVEQAPEQIFHDVQAAPIKVSDTAMPQQNTEAPDVGQQVASSLAGALQQGDSRVQIDLTPEYLGSVRVEITHTAEGTIHVVLAAENGETRGLLERHAEQLQNILSNQGRETVQVEVQRQQESQQNQNQQQYDGRNGHNGQPQQEEGQRRRRSHSENPQDFMHQLRLGLIPADGE